MNKILRLFSTLLLLFGIAAITYYVLFCGETTGVELLSQPSYYVRQSLWFIFLTGAAVTGLSVLANFFSWNRKGEKKEEELKNAGFVEHEEIEAWLGETVSPDGKGKTTDPEETRSGDTEKIEAADSTERLNGQAEQSADETERLTAGEGETEILPREEKEGETEILPREEKEGETEILPREEKEGETEILLREEEAVVWDEAPEEEEPFELLPEFRKQKKAEEESGRPETEEEEIPEEGDPELRTVFLGKNEAPERVDQRTAQQRMDTLPDGRPRWAEDGTEILYAEYPRDAAAASRPRYWTEDGTEILNYDRMGAPAASERGGTV